MILRQLQFLRQGARSTRGLAEPSEALNQAIVLGLIMLLVPPLLFYFYLKTRFSGLTYLDALDFAQLGRNLSQGHGFVTEILRPLALTHGNDPLNQSDVTHGPLFPFVLALFFGALGANDVVAADVSGLFYLLTIPALYFLGARMFGRPVGLLTTIVFTFNALILEFAISGTYDTLYIFLMTCLLFALYNAAAQMQVPQTQVKEPAEETASSARKAGEPVRPVGKASLKIKQQDKGTRLPQSSLILAGLLTGLLYLTDPIFFWIMPVLLGAVVLLGGARRWQALLAFAAPLCLLALPWMWRNALLTGNPVFGLRGTELWMNTKDYYPGLIAYRMMPGDLVPGIELFKSVVQKIILGLDAVIQTLPQVSASWILAFFLPCLLFRFSSGAANILRLILLSCFGALLFGMLLFGIQMPLFVSLVPAMLIFSVAYLLFLLQQAQLNRLAMGTLNALLALALILPLVTATVIAGKTPPLPAMPAALALSQSKAVMPNEIVLSDQPWLVAWYMDRPSIWIPANDGQILTLRQRFPGSTGTSWLFLTQSVTTFSPAWSRLHDGLQQQWNMPYFEYHRNKINYDQYVQYVQEHPERKIIPAPLQPAPPPTPVIKVAKGNTDTVDSLFRALNGMTAVEPQEFSDSSTVIARLAPVIGQSGGPSLPAPSGSSVTPAPADGNAVGNSNVQPGYQYDYSNPQRSIKHWKAILNAKQAHPRPAQRPADVNAVENSNVQPGYQYDYSNPQRSLKHWKAILNTKQAHPRPTQRPLQ